MRKLIPVLALALVLASCNACTGVPVDTTTPPEIIEEVNADLPPKADADVMASKITTVFLEEFGAATSADGTLTLGEAIDVAFDTTETGLKAGQVWDRRIAHSTHLTVGDVFALARSTINTSLVATNLDALALYSPDMPYADLGNELANYLSAQLLGAFEGGFVTIGEIVDVPLKLAQKAMTLTDVMERVVGTVSGATAPTKIGDLYMLGVATTQNTLRALKLWDVILWRTE